MHKKQPKAQKKNLKINDLKKKNFELPNSCKKYSSLLKYIMINIRFDFFINISLPFKNKTIVFCKQV